MNRVGFSRVLGPFAGVGSSGVAAKRAGRSWVGVDLPPEYCEIARNRIESAGPPEEIELPDAVRPQAEESASVLSRGAAEAGALELPRVQLSPTAGEWERYRRALASLVTIGAYAMVLRRDGSRTFWTTGNVPILKRWAGRSSIRTMQAETVGQLEASLFSDVENVLLEASDDRQTRAVTARGFNVGAPSDGTT